MVHAQGRRVSAGRQDPEAVFHRLAAKEFRSAGRRYAQEGGPNLAARFRSALKVKVLIAPLDSEALEKKISRFLEAVPSIALEAVQQTFALDKVLVTIYYRDGRAPNA